MKSYEERLPLIDEAIEYHNGKWPQDKSPYGEVCLVLLDNGNYITTMGIAGKDGYLCNKYQFEKRAKELGWICGYKRGVEYETNGEKPNLPEDVLIEIECTEGNRDLGSRLVKYNDWSRTKSFHIVDKFYKTKEREANNDWYGNGELPPANTECEVRIEGQWLPTVVVGHYANEAVVVDPCVTTQRFFCTTANNLRSLQSETDKLLGELERSIKNSGEDIFYQLNTKHIKKLAKYLHEQDYRKIKPMSEEEFVSEIQAELSEFKTNWASHLYRAGCRFIDKGDNDE